MVSRMLLETEKHFQFLELQENQNVGKALIVTVVEANLVDDRHRMNLKFEVEKLTTEKTKKKIKIIESDLHCHSSDNIRGIHMLNAHL